MGQTRILTINSGSSSLKVALYEFGAQESRILSIDVDRIGAGGSADQREALTGALERLQASMGETTLDGAGHRIVHGGSKYREPQVVSTELLAELRSVARIAPEHVPQALAAIEVVSHKYPDLPQIACFDTAFHRQMPRVAQLCPLPKHYYDEGILRYGFHGLSYEYILSELPALDRELANGCVIVAHLGNGASMAAIKNGKSLDTSMGFTPAAGLLMGTRSGDLDPGVLAYLSEEKEMTGCALATLINKQSGLLGISGLSGDMRDLLEKEAVDADAASAIALYCYSAKKYLGAYTAILGGLDILVFTAGVGEHAASIRDRICSGLEFLGIEIDPARNRSNAPVISSDRSRVKIRVMKTNEDLMIARHAARLVGRK